MPGRCWTRAEDDIMRGQYGRAPNATLAVRLGRTVAALHIRARLLGLAERRCGVDASRVARMNRDGYSDAEIAAAVGTTRENIRYHRRRMGLPDNRSHPRQQDKRVADGRRMNAEYPSRWKATASADANAFARESGWPIGLRLRQVQILNFVASAGRPMTRREITAGVGIAKHPDPGYKRLMTNNGRAGYIAELAGMRLLTRLTAMGPRSGNGRRLDLFVLGPVALQCLIARAVAKSDGSLSPSVRG